MGYMSVKDENFPRLLGVLRGKDTVNKNDPGILPVLQRAPAQASPWMRSPAAAR